MSKMDELKLLGIQAAKLALESTKNNSIDAKIVLWEGIEFVEGRLKEMAAEASTENPFTEAKPKFSETEKARAMIKPEGKEVKHATRNRKAKRT